MEMTVDERQLWLENKKLSRELKRVKKDNEILRMANEQTLRTQAYIQRGSVRQLFYIDQMLRNSPNIMIMTDHQLRTIMTTDVYYTYSEAYDKDAIQRGIPLRDAMAELLGEAELDELLRKCERALAREPVESYILRCSYRGKSKSWRANIRCMSMEDMVIGLNVMLADMTEVMDAMERAEAADKAKSAFLANMSHEIRTPINAILGLNEVILRESGERDTLSYAADIQTAGKTLLSLINDILDFSKVEEGKMEILPTQYELGSVINDLVNMTRDRAEEKGLNFYAFVDETTPHLLFGDEIRVRQCALNLLTNAVKYTEKGSVTLTVGYEELDTDKILLKVSVSDTGIGLKPEDMERLCSPFARIEEWRNRNIEGTGLGLSITKQLLTLMGSSLQVESIYGEGSEFSFAIEQPVVKWWPVGEFKGHYETGEEQRAARREAFHAPDARVLVVDDVAVNLTVVKGLLRETKIAVDTAESGAAAIEKAARQLYDVIFIDHMMPQMDGIETLRELKKLPGTQHTVFIALTANAISGSRKLYIDAGFTDYLSKPVDGGRLEEMLMKYLPPTKLISREAAEESAKPELPSVFVVGGEQICALVRGILKNGFRVDSCCCGEDAAGAAERLRPDLILMDVNVGGTSGFEVLHALKRSAATHDIPVVFMTDEENTDVEELGFRNGASDFIRKAYLPDALARRARRIIEIDRLQSDLQSEIKRQTLRADRLEQKTMLTLSKAADAKDLFRDEHSLRVAAYAAEIARRMGKSAVEQRQIYEIGLLHNTGMLGASEDTGSEPAHPSEGAHSEAGRRVLFGSIRELPELVKAAHWQHERYDGSGYPDGLKGDEIPESARIIAVAVAYDAMTSSHADARPMTQERARAELIRCSGTQFDPAVARIMLDMIDEDSDFKMNERDADISIWRGSERLWPACDAPAGGEAPESTPPPAEGLPDWLCRVEGLDVLAGMKRCGSEETYLDTLKIYADTAQTGADEIESYWRAGDIGNVTTKVHALKSTSRVIGAEPLGALAERLEAAGKAGDTNTLADGLDDLLERYRELGRRLAPLCGQEETDDRPEIAQERLDEAYDSIREVIGRMDYEKVEGILQYLDSFSLPERERGRYAEIRRAADDFEWDRIGELLA